jgi:ferredoxin, 2Fe-2S
LQKNLHYYFKNNKNTYKTALKMPYFIVENLKKQFEVNNQETILLNLQHIHQDWMQACGGKGRCVTCRIEVLEGMENLSDRTAAEEKFLLAGKLLSNERLLCQTTLLKEKMVGKVSEICKLPHLYYND